MYGHGGVLADFVASVCPRGTILATQAAQARRPSSVIVIVVVVVVIVVVAVVYDSGATLRGARDRTGRGGLEELPAAFVCCCSICLGLKNIFS